MMESSDAHGVQNLKRGEPPGPPLHRPAVYPEIVDAPGFSYVAQQLLVDAHDRALVAGEIRRFGGRVDEDTTERLGNHVVSYLLPAEVDIPTLVIRLRANPRGAPPRVGPNHVFTSQQNGIAISGQPATHGGPYSEPRPVSTDPAISTQGAGGPVIVAVLDTGIAADAEQLHPVLKGRLLPGDFDAVYGPGPKPKTIARDCGGHGTFAAGLIARLAPSARILPISVLTPQGVGTDVSFAQGLDRARQAGAQVVNASLAGPLMPNVPAVAGDNALGRLGPGVSVVVAAGNSGSSGSLAAPWPAANARTAPVGALDTHTNQTTIASFSNSGPWVKFCAPGVWIHSNWVKGNWYDADSKHWSIEGCGTWCGTSFATPQVVAAIVNRMAANPNTTARDVENYLFSHGGPHVPDLGTRITPPVNVVYVP